MPSEKPVRLVRPTVGRSLPPGPGALRAVLQALPELLPELPELAVLPELPELAVLPELLVLLELLVPNLVGRLAAWPAEAMQWLAWQPAWWRDGRRGGPMLTRMGRPQQEPRMEPARVRTGGC
jgi:hypothetical protein